MRWLTLAAFFFLVGCANISNKKKEGELSSFFINAVDSVAPVTDKKKPINSQLDDSVYLKLNNKFDLSHSSRALLSVDSALLGWEETALDKVNKSYAEFVEYLFGSLVADAPYLPKAHEISYLSFNLSLNHALMGRYDLAAVEARKIANREEVIERFNKKAYESIAEQEKFNADLGDEAHVISKIELIDNYPIEDFNHPKVRALKNSYQNASANYLSGFIFEAENDYSLARPAYLKALNLNPESQLFRKSINLLDKKVKSDVESEVLIILESGVASSLSVKRFKFGVPTSRGWRSTNIALPIIDSYDVYKDSRATIFLNNQIIDLELTTDTDILLRRYLRDNMPKYLSMATTKALIQIASQITLSQSTKKLRQYDYGATEILGSIAIDQFMSIGQPDTRTWKALPSNIQMARLSLKKGNHNISIRNGSKSHEVSFSANKPYQVISLRVIDGKLFNRVEVVEKSQSDKYYESIFRVESNKTILQGISEGKENLIKKFNFNIFE